MNIYVEKLKSYLLEQLPDYGDSDASSLLEMLYDYYTTTTPTINERIRNYFSVLDNILAPLSWEENNAVFDLTCTLCSEYERHAFLEGLHVGVRLITELSEH